MARNSRKTIQINASDLVSRQALAADLGQQFGGHRDIFHVAGYEKIIPFERYKARYKRQDIAQRIVDAAAEETWRKSPEIFDGESLDDAKEDTQFVKDWKELVSVEEVGEELEDRKTFWHYLSRVDRLSGVGRFGGLLVGINDGEELSQPLRRKSVSGPSGFLYLSAFDEGDIEIKTLVEDKTSRRYGLPDMYRLDMGTDLEGGKGSVGLGSVDVHWSRVIHVAEDLQSDEIYGTPRLQSVWNRLIDLEKILAGSGESAWRLMYKGMVLSTKDGYKLEDDEVTQAKIDEFVHGLTRTLQLEGMDVTDMGGEVVDPTGVATLNVAFISAATGIPQRILLGSERAELASSQDEKNWARVIATRCRNFAEPIILRPLVNRLVYAGVLSPPASGRYVVKWPDFSEPDAKIDSEVAKAYAEALEKMAAITGQSVGLPDFLDEYMKGLSGKTIIEAKAEPPQDVQEAPDEPQGDDDSVEPEETTEEAPEEMENDQLEANVRAAAKYWNERLWERYPS